MNPSPLRIFLQNRARLKPRLRSPRTQVQLFTIQPRNLQPCPCLSTGQRNRATLPLPLQPRPHSMHLAGTMGSSGQGDLRENHRPTVRHGLGPVPNRTQLDPRWQHKLSNWLPAVSAFPMLSCPKATQLGLFTDAPTLLQSPILAILQHMVLVYRPPPHPEGEVWIEH